MEGKTKMRLSVILMIGLFISVSGIAGPQKFFVDKTGRTLKAKQKYRCDVTINVANAQIGSEDSEALVYEISNCSSKRARGGSCFISGTRVNTPSGLVPIEELETGDKVYSYDEKMGEIVIGEVTKTFRHPKAKYGILTTNNGIRIGVTPEHPFYIGNSGRWESLGELTSGTPLFTLEKSVTKLLVERYQVNKEDTVYNIQVKDYSNYFVEGILVHNKED